MAFDSERRERRSAAGIDLRPCPAWLAPLLALAFLLVGCGSETPIEPTPTVSEQSEQVVPTETAAVSEVAFVEEADEPADRACIDCHQDKDQLIDTADPEEPVEAESSGEG